MEIKYDIMTNYTHYDIDISEVKEILIKYFLKDRKLEISINQGDKEILLIINGKRMICHHNFNCFEVAKVKREIREIINSITEEDVINYIKKEKLNKNKKVKLWKKMK